MHRPSWLALILVLGLALAPAPADAQQLVQSQALDQLQDQNQVVDQAEAGQAGGNFDNVAFEGELPASFDGPPVPVPPQVVSRDDNGRVTIRAVRVGEELVIDGRLDEPIYSRLEPVSNFIMQEPQDNVPATEQTDVWILFDDTNLYVSGRNWDSQPNQIIANEMRRDGRNIGQNDNFTLVLDTFYDRRNGFYFQTNPLGAVMDGLITDERQLNRDWNTVWDVRTTMDDEGWNVEMVIPFKSLRYGPGRDQIWGLNVRRGVQWKNEDSFITAIPRALSFSAQYRLSLAATLVGLQTPPMSRNLEVKPYAISAVTGTRASTDEISDDLTGDVGFDGKYGLTQGLTADFTVNTDFAQVEDDDEQVNLTRFSLFFPEKREFFLEGQGIFSFGGAGGRRGFGGGGGGGGGSAPILFFSRQIGLSGRDPVPIRAGGRVTGRAGAFTLGLLNVQTGEDGDIDALATNFSVVRVRSDIFRRSSIGFMGTNRSVAIDGDGSSQSYGLDAAFSFLENLNISSYYAQTQTPGLSGENTSYSASIRNEGDRYGFSASHLLVGKNFNPEVGFVRRDDYRQSRAQLQFSPRPRSIRAIRRFEFKSDINYITHESTGILESRDVGAEFQISFENTDRFTVNAGDKYEFLFEDFRIADGVVLPPGGYNFSDVRVSYWMGAQRNPAGNISVTRGGFFSGDRTQLSYFGRIEVSPQLSVEPRASVNWIDLPQGSFNTRLVSARANYTLSPRMLVAALVQYNSSSDSISTNVRFRWEYEPGSDIFVVYSEGRETDHRGFPRISNRGFVVKFTKLFRI
ncbi:MAG: DUF5916 domain-containing protein [Vicinamibacterales bacterium]|nr:DUF5916 domain-containing protein [Vicinamibacterales bacterium]MDP6609548.1 DUF5916 domain-containing protein [Vicinamibacterales bacterium]